MDDLPELPFEKVLSYLSLKDRLKARAVSRRWYRKINSFRVKSFCFSERPSDFILEKGRWVSGAFAKNFISSTRFTSFFDTFGQTILSSLKHLRLCDVDLSKENPTAVARILNSFSQLEELDIIRVELNKPDVLNLNLPILTNLNLEHVEGIEKLTLEAPRLREVKILDYYLTDLRLEIVHGESVERLLIDSLRYAEVKNLKNLKALYIGDDDETDIDSPFLSGLQQLKEIHLFMWNMRPVISELFEQKQRLGRSDLKIYFCGLLLNGPDDPAINVLDDHFDVAPEWLVCLAENRSRLADQIPLQSYIYYSGIEGVAPGLEVDLLKRFTDFNKITVDRPVEDIERFLNLLKNCSNIALLWFKCDQPQELFDRLPEHCAVQSLSIDRPPSDLTFLFRLKHLIELHLGWSIDRETVRQLQLELASLNSSKSRLVSVSLG